MTDERSRKSISPAALPLADAARLLIKVGGDRTRNASRSKAPLRHEAGPRAVRAVDSRRPD